MGSAKITIMEQDRSAIVPSFSGVYAGITVVSDKGPFEPMLITTTNQLIDNYGIPNPKLGTAMYSALNYLSEGNKLWVTRASHSDATYSAVLVRSKITPIPKGKTDVLSDESLIVKPLTAGLTTEQLASYDFPIYSTNRVYKRMINSIVEDVYHSTEVRVNIFNGLEVGDYLSFTNTNIDLLNDPTDTVGESEFTYRIEELIVREITYDNGILDTPVSVTKGDSIKKVDIDGITLINYPGNPTVVRTASNTTNILISNSDYIADGDLISIDGTQVVFNEKNFYSESANILRMSDILTLSADIGINKVIQSEFEDRDAFLVYSANPGVWGNYLSIAITPSRDYANAFNLIVYYKGVQVESWEVTRTHELDGFGHQLFSEYKINGKSSYIKVLDNLSDVDSNGNPTKPLNTDYSLWRQNPDDVFVPTEIAIVENLLLNHVEVKLDTVVGLALGTRIKFLIGDNFQLSKEYKVFSIDSVNKTVILDRPIEENEIPMVWVDNTGADNTTLVYFFDATNNSISNGIVDGIQYYPISVINNVYYNYKLNSKFTISGVAGSLLSAGANMATGGSLGSPVTVGDLITAIKKLSNKEHTPVTLLLDGGFTYPAYAQALQSVAKSQNLTHVYLSDDPAAEEGPNYVTNIVAYKNSTMINDHTCSMFAGWIKVYDEYNQIDVWVSPEGFAAASQCYTTRNYSVFTPAAGWLRGKVSGLDVKVKFEEGDRDYLVDNRINPIRYKEGSGLVIWGNETMLVKPSPMQLRSVAMLLIVIKTGLEGMLEYKTFDQNNEREWTMVEGSLNGFMRDEIQAKGGVYKYSLTVSGVITKSDIDNRRMPVFLGIQPTMDIKEIPVTLAIFNSTVDITI